MNGHILDDKANVILIKNNIIDEKILKNIQNKLGEKA